MKIDCILKTWQKLKVEPNHRFYEVPIYNIQYYVDNDEYDVKYALQIVAINSDGDVGMVLTEKVFIPTGNSIHYINYWSANYQYDESKHLIYTTQTERDI
jgi:hypothetical protein